MWPSGKPGDSEQQLCSGDSDHNVFETEPLPLPGEGVGAAILLVQERQPLTGTGLTKTSSRSSKSLPSTSSSRKREGASCRPFADNLGTRTVWGFCVRGLRPIEIVLGPCRVFAGVGNRLGFFARKPVQSTERKRSCNRSLALSLARSELAAAPRRLSTRLRLLRESSKLHEPVCCTFLSLLSKPSRNKFSSHFRFCRQGCSTEAKQPESSRS